MVILLVRNVCAHDISGDGVSLFVLGSKVQDILVRSIPALERVGRVNELPSDRSRAGAHGAPPETDVLHHIGVGRIRCLPRPHLISAHYQQC
jgi:hypothetical protein